MFKYRGEFEPVLFKQGRSNVIVEDEPLPTIIKVRDLIRFKGDAIIRDGCYIEGSSLTFGANAYLDRCAGIGGGSCYEGKFECGRNFHLGSYALVNTARDVTTGDNVGIGRMSLLATHGAYLDVTQGFPEQLGPIKIGSNVWAPYAIILPNVTIGDNTVIAAGSLVNRSIKGGGLWAGWPAKQVEGVKYPNPMSKEDRDKYLSQFGGDKNLMRRHGVRDI